MRKTKLEKTFQSEFSKSVKNHFNNLQIPYYYKKIKDLGDQNPYDCFLRFNKQHIAFELKMNSSVKTFNFRQMFYKREHELYHLALEEQIGFKGYVIINHYLRTHQINAIFCLSVNQTIQYHKKGSVQLEEIEKDTIKLSKVKGFIDLTKIIT